MDKINLPISWQKLINVVFGENDIIFDAKNRIDIADAAAYYDDNRQIETKLSNGTILTVYLSSGQSNYWVSYDLQDDENVLYESEPLDSIGDVIEFTSDTGVQIKVEVIWV